MAVTNRAHMSDEINVSLNGDNPAPEVDDAKGPDPEHWPAENRTEEPEYIDDKVKGPDPTVWGEQSSD